MATSSVCWSVWVYGSEEGKEVPKGQPSRAGQELAWLSQSKQGERLALSGKETLLPPPGPVQESL